MRYWHNKGYLTKPQKGEKMANKGHIIIKGDKTKDIQRFYTPVDKGSSRPAFCYAKKVENFREDVASMRRAIDQGRVVGERKMQFEQKLAQKTKRLREIEDNCKNAKAIIKEDPDGWAKRREELAEIIKNETPAYSDEKKRKVNPHAILKAEKGGLGQARKEYVIISRAMDEESNTSFLQKD
jgi:hypothetical protein